jgi:hypothetical protein
MSDEANLGRLKEMAIRGKEYREENEYDYFGETMTLFLKALTDQKLIPLTGALQSKFGMDIEDASEEIEESRDDEGDIDPGKLDEEFVNLMARVAVEGIDKEQGDAEGHSQADLEAVFGIAEEDDDNIGLRGGLTLEVAQDVLDIADDEDNAEKFRR